MRYDIPAHAPGRKFAYLATPEPKPLQVAEELREFQFHDVSSAEFSLAAYASGYAFHSDRLTPLPGSVEIQDRRLYPNRRIVIHYAHQTNGTRTLLGDGVVTGRISWLNGAGGVDFSEGVVEEYEPDDLRDLEMRQTQDVLQFRNFYVNGYNGFYDAGAVGFDEIAEAATGGYTSGVKPAIVGHVYVVRTYEEAQYVKFIVESDESSFRSVIPGDPDPLVFAGYGLTVDFTFTTGYSQLFVERELMADGTVASRQLPYDWQLTGLDGIGFGAIVVFSYLDEDLIARRVPEVDLDVWRSTNGGLTWQPLTADLDAAGNTLIVSDTQSLGWFALASPYDYYFGDMDFDNDVDLQDVSGVMTCYSGAIVDVNNPACVPALTNVDAKVSQTDIAQVTSCMAGPSVLPTPVCRE